MISHVAGRVTAVAPTTAVVDVGGVGLTVQCAPATLVGLQTGQSVTIATSLVVREDSLTLYGFADDDERTTFELVQKVSGVGPRLAQAMLAVHAPNELRRIVATENLAALTQVPGIGRKGAQRIVLELKDRLGPASHATAAQRSANTTAAPWQEQVHGALLGLGWSAREAEQAVSDVAGDDALAETTSAASPDIAALLRAALRRLGPR